MPSILIELGYLSNPNDAAYFDSQYGLHMVFILEY